MSRPLLSPADWARIQLFAMDVDGILTDGTIWISSDGTEAKQFTTLDGQGLKLLEKAGVVTAWISGRESGVTTIRARELRIPHVIQGAENKLTALQALAGKLGFAPAQCAYMGDDLIDLEAMAWAGLAFSVPGAVPAAQAGAHLVTQRAGGSGAVREICDLILAHRAK